MRTSGSLCVLYVAQKGNQLICVHLLDRQNAICVPCDVCTKIYIVYMKSMHRKNVYDVQWDIEYKLKNIVNVISIQFNSISVVISGDSRVGYMHSTDNPAVIEAHIVAKNGSLLESTADDQPLCTTTKIKKTLQWHDDKRLSCRVSCQLMFSLSSKLVIMRLVSSQTKPISV